jgi:hypothetical protein
VGSASDEVGIACKRRGGDVLRRDWAIASVEQLAHVFEGIRVVSTK